jgi:hypothetical protein
MRPHASRTASHRTASVLHASFISNRISTGASHAPHASHAYRISIASWSYRASVNSTVRACIARASHRIASHRIASRQHALALGQNRIASHVRTVRIAQHVTYQHQYRSTARTSALHCTHASHASHVRTPHVTYRSISTALAYHHRIGQASQLVSDISIGTGTATVSGTSQQYQCIRSVSYCTGIRSAS